MPVVPGEEIGLLQLVVLSVVQGVTEFLPISSSAHLILVPHLTPWSDQGLAVDVATHVGTLAAVMLYFRKETAALVRGSCRLLVGDTGGDGALALRIAVATVPVVAAGLLLHETVETTWRSASLIGWMSILFGVLLFAADRRSGGSTTGAPIGFRAAVLIGCAQALALVPGVSRSGITMTAALFLGASRTEAARFSLLLSIPVTFAAGVLTAAQLAETGVDARMLGDMAFAAAVAGATAWLAIAGMMRWLARATFTPFVVYRVALGVLLLTWLA